MTTETIIRPFAESDRADEMPAYNKGFVVGCMEIGQGIAERTITTAVTTSQLDWVRGYHDAHNPS